MKKALIKLLGLCFGIALFGAPIEANAENYYWNEEDTVKAWYKTDRPGSPDSVKLEGMPDVGVGDFITIDVEPSEECAQWLKELSGDMEYIISSFTNSDIQVGNPDSGEKLVAHLNAYYGNMTYYGDVRHIRTGIGNLHVIGDVGSIALGDHQSACGEGTITITGNVESIGWYPKTDIGYNVGFGGSITVSGTVNSGTIHEYVYDATLEQYGWHTPQNIGLCADGTFQMANGTLDSNVPLTPYEPEEINYKYQYQCNRTPDNFTSWTKQVYDADTNELIAQENCLVSDIEENASVIVYGTSTTTPVEISANLEHLDVYVEGDSQKPAKVIVNGNVQNMLLLSVTKAPWDVTINGNVDYLNVNYFYSPDHNVTITGTIERGRASEDNDLLGFFTSENMQIIENGDWNPSLYMVQNLTDAKTVAYKRAQKEEINNALESENIGESVVVNTGSGSVTLIKDSKLNMTQTPDNAFSTLIKTDSMKEAMEKVTSTDADVEAITAIDIDLKTIYRDSATNVIFTGDTNYEEKPVTELSEGKELDFSIKVPDACYEPNAKYTVVRHHENSDGSITDEALDTTQTESTLSFSSDKFSTFVIVKITGDGNTGDAGVSIPGTSQPEGTFATTDDSYFVKDGDEVRCFNLDGTLVINEFKCDGTYTYYFQADGTAMRDRLTYHPDGDPKHVIYFDENGHEVFSNFANVKMTIAGEQVDDLCFFDVYGYLYVDVITYDQAGENLYYANPYGIMDRGKWFEFSDTVKWADGTPFDKAGGKYGYANENGTLMTNQWTYDWEGRQCYMQGNGVALY